MSTRRTWCLSLSCWAVTALILAAHGADWPQFRGPERDNISKEMGLLRQWPTGGPNVMWTVPVAQGYAGAAIVGGRVYHHDYDEARNRVARPLPVLSTARLSGAQGGPGHPSQPRHYAHRAGGGRQVRLLARPEIRATLP